MKDKDTTSRTLVVQLDAGDRQAVRKNAKYTRLSTRLEELRGAFLAGTRTRSQYLRGCAYNMAQLPVPVLNQGAQEVAGVAADQPGYDDVQAIIPWAQLDVLQGVDVPVLEPVGLPVPIWQPWL